MKKSLIFMLALAVSTTAAAQQNSFRLNSAGRDITKDTPLPVEVRVPVPTGATPLTGTSTGAQTVGPYTPISGRAITVSLSAATWPGGNAQIFRSMDNCATMLPLTPAGVTLGVYSQQGVDQPWIETEPGATFCLSLPAAGISYRISQ